MVVVGGILLIALGQLMLWDPGLFYELTEGWKSRGSGEPSRLYWFSVRFGGVMVTLAGLGGILSLFL